MFEHTSTRVIAGHCVAAMDNSLPADEDAHNFLVPLAIIIARAIDLKKGLDFAADHLIIKLCDELPPNGGRTTGRSLRLNSMFYYYGDEGEDDHHDHGDVITATGPVVDGFTALFFFKVFKIEDSSEDEFKIGLTFSRDSRLALVSQ